MESTNLVLVGYYIYLPIVIALVIFVSKKLFSSGEYFMKDIFHGQDEIAMATNKLFEVGFYLMNIGFALYIIKLYRITTAQGLVESLSYKIGGFSIYLGLMLMLNLYLFMRGRKRAQLKYEA